MGPAQRPIVVGIDGSRAAEHAARWAAEQARDLEAPLQLVHALTWPYDRARPPTACCTGPAARSRSSR